MEATILAAGTRLGHYSVLGQIGAGGMGVVYRARDERLDREVAIKVLPREVADDPDRLTRFEREAKALARLSHPNILRVFELGEERGRTFVVTELLEGETLRERLVRGPLPWRQAVETAAAIADGLAAAHAQGVVHRDVKPDNVFVTTEGQVKLLDFGLARLAEPELPAAELSSAPTAAPATAAGVALGTVGYMAPEQVRGQPVDGRSDVFSLGCLVYELVSGTRPFTGTTGADTFSAILTATPPALTGGGAPPALRAIVERCLEKRPEQRFQSARDLGFTLRSISAALPPLAKDMGAPKDGRSQARPSIAVLPPVNLSADPEQEYFCDGMADEIINALAHVDGLRVIARTSAFAFKGCAVDIREIGARLDVDHVLEGSVRRVGNRLRITAQLIEVQDGSHVWSGRFDRQLEDVFAIQDEIALAIVDSLKVKLLGEERAAIVRRHTTSLDAHNAYLKGVYFWNRLSPEGYARSRECLEEAIELDPGYAPALAQLAIWYGSQAFWGTMAPSEVRPRVTSLLGKVFALDAVNPEAHALLGVIQGFIERDWAAGERSLRKGVELAPNDAVNWMNLACLLLARGGLAEMAQCARRAQSLDPLSPTLMTWTASWMGYAGELDEARAELERQRGMHPGHWLPHHYLGDILARQGLLSQARSELERAVEASGGAPISLGLLACVCFRAGDRRAGDDLLGRLEEQAQSGYVPPMFLAWAHLARGDGEAAAIRAREALEGHDPWLAFHRFVVPVLVPADVRLDALICPVLP